ncbi:monoamine oxidase [Allokutzneria albata]|uniref:Monoamine oxidase n=1 Tax=Allokutzneria albata TaxID=211114 RepID=A0A1G9R0M2_ALLAB|nr:monoamine oxidase [Allokutzneria albata]
MTRRRVLSAVGATGGVGALLRAMGVLGFAPTAGAQDPAYRAPRLSDLRQPRGPRKRVLVIGAGVAGLASVYELRKAGYDCVVLEARNRPGGRVWTVRKGTVETDVDGHTQLARFAPGQYMNAGASRIAPDMVTLDYCRELGVPIEAFSAQNANAYYVYEDGGSLSGKPVRHRTGKADMYGYMAELLTKATNRGALDQELTEADRELLLDFLRDWGDIDTSGEYTGSERRGFVVPPGAGERPGVVGDPFPLSDLLESGLGFRFSDEFDPFEAMPLFQPVGGMDRIARALVDAIGEHRITYDAVVQSITTSGAGVAVVFRGPDGRSRTERADYCICTIPPQILKKIPTNFSKAVRNALAAPVPVRAGKLGIQYGRRWWEEDDRIYGGTTYTDLDLTLVEYPSWGFHGKRGIIHGFYNFDAEAERYGDLSPAARLSRALSQGEKIHGPKFRRDVEASFSVAWQKTRYSMGGWTTWPGGSESGPRPGDPNYARLLRPEGRVYFAGDHLSHMNGWTAGAFLSARKVVGDLHARVVATG